MTGASKKYVLDTHLFIKAFRDPEANARLEEFHWARAPFEYLSDVVAQELRAGTQQPEDRRKLERHVLGIYERAGRAITPSATAWHRSGDVLAAMRRDEGLELARLSKAFANDVLLALSCREAGCVLVTENTRDFSRIRRFVAFDFVAPWP
jgi:predicted nucleic acid-binding protein